jgi:D-alanyl-D-alanine carboxypeptidase
MTTRRSVLAGGLAVSAFGTTPARADASAWNAALGRIATGNAAPPALAGMVVGREGPLWIGARGVRRAGSTDAATGEDLWHLGSNTKAMTAALYGRLVDQGRANWGASLHEALPDVPMHEAWRDTPLTAVMGHVAGLTDEIVLGRAWLTTARADLNSLPAQRRTLVETMLAVPPAGTPGIFAYGNANYVLLGAVVERITGLAWEDAIRVDLFEPLGLTSGGFGAPTGDQPWGHRGGVALDPAGPVSDNPLALGPAGTAHMTLSDYAKFLGLFITEGGGLLSPETMAVLTRPVREGPALYAGGWGVALGRPWAQGPVLTHDGSNTFWYLSAWVAPGTGRAFVAASNDGVAGGDACRRLIPGLIASN